MMKMMFGFCESALQAAPGQNGMSTISSAIAIRVDLRKIVVMRTLPFWKFKAMDYLLQPPRDSPMSREQSSSALPMAVY
jgi:hypothetical protein